MMVEFDIRCKCGGCWRGTVPLRIAEQFQADFIRIHNDPGCRVDGERCFRAQAETVEKQRNDGEE